MNFRTRLLMPAAFVVATALASGMAWAGEGAAVTARAGSTAATPTAPVRPGPDLLYRPLAKAPQFENAWPWRSNPILTSGASAYRKGEFLYQDFIYDDFGANTGEGDTSTIPVAGALVLAGVGDYTYPSDKRYVNNAADLVELRVKLLPTATAFRFAFNSMLSADLTATTLALGGTAGVTHPVPAGANAREPASIFATVHGGHVDLVNALTGLPISGSGATAKVDVRRRQVEVLVPFGVWDPRGQGSVRLAAASGLWDTAGSKYLIPQGTADASHPGGAGNTANPPAFFNVAFRYSEAGYWNDRVQATALQSGDLSSFFGTVDFRKLAGGVTDEMLDQPGGTPAKGLINRIYASHFEPQQGRAPAPPACKQPCPNLIPDLPGNLQPYLMYVPTKAPPASGYGLTYNIHGAAGNYRRDETAATPGIPDQGKLLGERGSGSLVVWPGGRGGTLWWWGIAAAEIFELMADMKAHYHIDPKYIEVMGASMGGSGTLRTISLWPDLFARLGAQIPCVSADTSWLGPSSGPPPSGEATVLQNLAPSLRNVPIFVQAAAQDVICDFPAQTAYRDAVDALGYRYEWRSYPGEHISGAFGFGITDAAALPDFLGDVRLGPDPHHVTYVMNLKANENKFGLNADHAYWVSGLKLRDGAGDAPLGQVDVVSHGFGIKDAPVLATEPIAGPANTYVGQQKKWGTPERTIVSNSLDIVTKNISTMTIDVARARVRCDATLNVHSDGPLQVRLQRCAGGASRTRTFHPVRSAGERLATTGPATTWGLLGLTALCAAAALSRRRDSSLEGSVAPTALGP